MSPPDEPVSSIAVGLVQLLLVLCSNFMFSGVARDDIESTGSGLALWSFPACGPRVKQESGSCWIVGAKAEDKDVMQPGRTLWAGKIELGEEEFQKF